VPLVYELDSSLKSIRSYYLSDIELSLKRSKSKSNCRVVTTKEDKPQRTISVPKAKPKTSMKEFFNKASAEQMKRTIKESLFKQRVNLKTPEAKTKVNAEHFIQMMKEYKNKSDKFIL
jgi:uncharacterized membrane protein YcgQ (UPF0703/DUF1980 family)